MVLRMAVLSCVEPGAAMQLVRRSWMPAADTLLRSHAGNLQTEIPPRLLLPERLFAAAAAALAASAAAPVALLPARSLAPAAGLQRPRPIGREEAVVQAMVP